METQLLRNNLEFPDYKTLKNALGDSSFVAYQNLMELITTEHYALVAEWTYYNDGKAWLCKVQHKKKTVFWLSVWDGFFKTTFYFTLKNCMGVVELNIDEKIKDDFGHSKSIGKLIPLTINIEHKEQLNDLLKIIEYKMSLK
jgi:hypothetical protein